MLDRLIPPPHHIVVKPGGSYLHGLWLALWMTTINVFTVCCMLMGLLLDGVRHIAGGIWVSAQYLGYALFGYVRHEQLTPEQWMQQGIGAKVNTKDSA